MSPYIMSYIEVFEKNGIPFELVYWNKTMEETSHLPNNYIPYNRAHDNSTAGWKKIFRIYGFARFVKKRMRSNEYAYAVVFTIAHALFFYPFITSRYKEKYVFDIRDHSPLCGLPFASRIIKRLVDNSAFTVLSSRGFLRWLPYIDDEKIVIAHNTTLAAVNTGFNFTPPIRCNYLVILTIGQIRDVGFNTWLIRSLAKEKDARLVFAGSGPAVKELMRFVGNINVDNTIFTGRYQKADEVNIVEGSSIINACTNRDVNSDTLMSNRFYLSVIHRKPMLVTSGTYQSEIAEQFELGVSLNLDDNPSQKIKEYYESLDWKQYDYSCKMFLKAVRDDLEIFNKKITQLYNKLK